MLASPSLRPRLHGSVEEASNHLDCLFALLPGDIHMGYRPHKARAHRTEEQPLLGAGRGQTFGVPERMVDLENYNVGLHGFEVQR